MSLNDIRKEFNSDISQIADELNNSLPMSKPQLRTAFSDRELKDLHVLLKEVNEATSENEKIVKIANNANSAFNLLKKLGVGL
jgi:adenine C2-methylase RlmN of 23S rRNA A2503 and tRNA A37